MMEFLWAGEVVICAEPSVLTGRPHHHIGYRQRHHEAQEKVVHLVGGDKETHRQIKWTDSTRAEATREPLAQARNTFHFKGQLDWIATKKTVMAKPVAIYPGRVSILNP
jgi:hypothetical protein